MAGAPVFARTNDKTKILSHSQHFGTDHLWLLSPWQHRPIAGSCKGCWPGSNTSRLQSEIKGQSLSAIRVFPTCSQLCCHQVYSEGSIQVHSQPPHISPHIRGGLMFVFPSFENWKSTERTEYVCWALIMNKCSNSLPEPAPDLADSWGCTAKWPLDTGHLWKRTAGLYLSVYVKKWITPMVPWVSNKRMNREGGEREREREKNRKRREGEGQGQGQGGRGHTTYRYVCIYIYTYIHVYTFTNKIKRTLLRQLLWPDCFFLAISVCACLSLLASQYVDVCKRACIMNQFPCITTHDCLRWKRIKYQQKFRPWFSFCILPRCDLRS